MVNHRLLIRERPAKVLFSGALNWRPLLGVLGDSRASATPLNSKSTRPNVLAESFDKLSKTKLPQQWQYARATPDKTILEPRIPLLSGIRSKTHYTELGWRCQKDLPLGGGHLATRLNIGSRSLANQRGVCLNQVNLNQVGPY